MNGSTASRIASAFEQVMHRMKLAISSHTTLKFCENKRPRARCANFFRSCLIWLPGSRKNAGGRKSRCGCCIYYRFYSPCRRSSLVYVILSPGAKGTLSATIREVFTVYRDNAATDLLSFAQTAGRIVGSWRRRELLELRYAVLEPTRRLPSLSPNPQGLLLKQMY
jgi:hypothetical protein